MKDGEIFIKRTTLGWFATEFVNLLAQGTLVYRRVFDFHPNKDKQQEYAEGAAQVAVVRKFMAYATEFKVDGFRAKGMMDGVSYHIYLGQRQLYFFCPDCSPDPEVRAMGVKLDNLFKQFGDFKSHESST
jgi:hypothetical protein